MSPRDRERARGRRRGDGAGPTLTTIWWRDIPVQVMARDGDGGTPARAELPARFTHAVDRAAMAADLAGTDAYLEQWRRRTRGCGPDLATEVDDEVARLVAAHPRNTLAALVANGGTSIGPPAEPDAEPAPDPARPTPTPHEAAP